MKDRLNVEATERLKNNQEYIDFLRWAEANGVVHPSLDFPAAFGAEGLHGIAAKCAISSSKAFLFVPYRICIGLQAANKALAHVFDAFPRVFHDHKYKNEFRLHAFIISEKLKGEQSFYYPYLRMLKNPEILVDWSEDEIRELQDPTIFDKVRLYSRKMNNFWQLLEPVFEHFSGEFPSNQALYSLYVWTYKLVQTRSFAWGDPEGMLIPFADFFNHADVYVSYETCTAEFLEANEDNLITYVDYRDFSGTSQSPRFDLSFSSRAHLNRLQKYSSSPSYSLPSLQALEAVWELDDTLESGSSSDDDYRVDLNSSDDEDVIRNEPLPQTEDDYFVVSTGKRCSFQPGEQVTLCYGRQNNTGLLLFYGFALDNYSRDAVFLDVPGCEGRIPSTYRLKANRLNEDVLSLFRKSIVSRLSKEGQIKPDMTRVMGLTPIRVSIEIETVEKTIQFYNQYISTRFLTSEAEDRELLQGEIAVRLKFAVRYRLSQRAIVRSQAGLLSTLLGVLRKVESHSWSYHLQDKSMSEIAEMYPLRTYLRAFKVNQALWEKNFFT